MHRALLAISLALLAPTSMAQESKFAPLMQQIQDADYRGDLPRLQRLYKETEPFLGDSSIASRVRYWRGFAQWRVAINGMNEPTPDKGKLKGFVDIAVEEFKRAAELDSAFTDAKIAEGACIGLGLFLNGYDPVRDKDTLTKVSQLFSDARKSDPSNLRLAWVIGPSLWNTPVERGGGDAATVSLYKKALETYRKDRPKPKGPLDPSWGEPEVLMNLAWSQLNRKEPNLEEAKTYAHEALKLVPHWHYVKDILLPQILSKG